MRPSQVELLLRGVLQGVWAEQLARELKRSRTTVHELRQGLHNQAVALQPDMPLSDQRTEIEEMFQFAEKKAPTMTIPLIRRDDGPTNDAVTAPLTTTVRRLPARSRERPGASSGAQAHRWGQFVQARPCFY